MPRSHFQNCTNLQGALQKFLFLFEKFFYRDFYLDNGHQNVFDEEDDLLGIQNCTEVQIKFPNRINAVFEKLGVIFLTLSRI